MRQLPRWLAIAIATVLVPVAVFLALYALLSQLTFFGEQPTHQGRALFFFLFAVALVLTAFAALALSRGREGVRAPVRARAAGAGLVQALGAAFLGGFVAWSLLVPLWDSVAGPVAFAIGAGASVALPRRTPLLLTLRLGLTAAVVVLTTWAAHRTGSDSFLALLLVVPAVGVADLLAQWWGRLRFAVLLAVIALLPAGEALSIHRHDEHVRSLRAAYERGHPRLPASTLGHDRIRWRAPLPGSGGVAAGPVLAAGRVVYAGYDGEVHALEPRDGSELWSTPAAVPGSSDLVAAGDIVLAPASSLLALDARTGAVRWRYTYVGGTATAVVAGRVVVVAGQVDGLVGLDLRNGVRLWSRSGPHVETMVFAAGAVVTATTSAPSVLGAVAPTSGKLRWRRRFPLPPRALVAAGGRIVVCEGGSRLVLDGRTGRTVGAAELPCSYSSVPGAPKLALDRRGPGGVIAVDPVDGRELWRVFELGFAPGDLRAVSSGAAVYLPWKDETTTPVTGGVEAYDAATGAALWRVDLTGGVSRRPAVAGGTLVVAGDLDCSSQPCTAAVYGLRR